MSEVKLMAVSQAVKALNSRITVLERKVKARSDSWDESAHERSSNGQFGHGSGKGGMGGKVGETFSESYKHTKGVSTSEIDHLHRALEQHMDADPEFAKKIKGAAAMSTATTTLKGGGFSHKTADAQGAQAYAGEHGSLYARNALKPGVKAWAAKNGGKEITPALLHELGDHLHQHHTAARAKAKEKPLMGHGGRELIPLDKLR